MNIKLYKVGGCVRDELLGLKPKDIDYSVVIELDNSSVVTEASDGLTYLEQYLESNGYTIFLKTPDTYTFRAKHNITKEVADFVLAKRKLAYEFTSHKSIVVLGSLEEDLVRRDFTINSMAISPESGELIDLFGGQEDLAKKILRTPLDPVVTLLDDPLRIFRALRFMVTKNLKLHPELYDGLRNKQIYEKLWRVVSIDRIREELNKMFSYNTTKSLELLVQFSEEIKDVYPTFLSDLFDKTGLWLKPTTEKSK